MNFPLKSYIFSSLSLTFLLFPKYRNIEKEILQKTIKLAPARTFYLLLFIFANENKLRFLVESNIIFLYVRLMPLSMEKLTTVIITFTNSFVILCFSLRYTAVASSKISESE